MEARSAPFFGTGPVSPRPAPRRLRPAWTQPGGVYEVELRTAHEIGADLAAWRALAERSVEPALFADPDVLLPALQHLPDGRQISLILVWQPAAPARLLRGLFPVAMPRIPLAPGEVRLWQPAGFPVSAALLDSERPAAVVAAVLSFCAARGQRCAGLAATALPVEGPLAEGLRTAAAASRRHLERLSPRHGVATAAAFAADEWPSRDPQLRLTQARTPGQVRDAVETFLVLDAAAAKERGTAALIQDAGTASFIRTMTRQLARRGLCRLDLVCRGAKPVAASVVLESAEALWLWRAAGAPGSGRGADRIVSAAAARARRAGKRLMLCDGAPVSTEAAAALALKPLALVDLLVSTRPGHSAGAAAIRLKTRIERRMRQAAAAGRDRLARA
jgi:Acetyltransferase (GNAT) domain